MTNINKSLKLIGKKEVKVADEEKPVKNKQPPDLTAQKSMYTKKTNNRVLLQVNAIGVERL